MTSWRVFIAAAAAAVAAAAVAATFAPNVN
jgi:hypothetical protein